MHLPFPIDLGRGAFALGLSVILYLFALNETNPETIRTTSFTIPLEVVNVPAGLVVTDKPPPVQLRVRAPLDVFNRLRPESFVGQVDATGASAGDQTLPVVVRSNDVDVQDVSAVPPQVRLHLEEVQERSVPVRVNPTGQVPSGYSVGDASADPARVTVSGPASVVQQAVEAVIDVSVDRVTVSVNGAYTPRAVDSHGNALQGLNIRPASVNVEIPINQVTQYKEVGVRPKTEGQPQAGYLLEPLEVDPPTVTIYGDPSALQSVNFVETDPVNVAGVTSSVVRRVAVVAPPNTLLLQPGQTVLVTVRVSPLTTTQTLRVTPAVVNLGQGLQVARSPDPVDITLSGPAPTLSNLTARDLRVVLDVSGKGAGHYDIQPTVQNLPQGMTLQGTNPKTVGVDIQVLPTPTPTPEATPGP